MACSLLLFVYLLNEHSERDLLSTPILYAKYIYTHSVFLSVKYKHPFCRAGPQNIVIAC